jgi:hypothetical protein
LQPVCTFSLNAFWRQELRKPAGLGEEADLILSEVNAELFGLLADIVDALAEEHDLLLVSNLKAHFYNY